MSRSRLLAGFAATTLAAAMLPGFAAAEVPSAHVPDDLKSVIQEHIESKGHDYAGLCRDVNQQSPVHIGEHCAFVLSIEHEIAEVTYGPVLSDELTFVSFELKYGEWEVRTDDEPVVQPTRPTQPSRPTAPTPRPPSTGSGADSGSDDDRALLTALAALGALGVFGLGASALTIRK